MSTSRSFRALTPGTLVWGAGLAALALAAATPAAAQYRGSYHPPAPAYAPHGSYGQAWGRADSRVVVTYGQPSPYEYGYSYGRAGVETVIREGGTRVYAATGVAATGRDGHDPYGDYYGDRQYQPPRPHDGFSYRYRQRHDGYGRGYDRGYDRGGRYGYSPYQGYRDEYGYQDDRPRSGRARRSDRYEYREVRRRDCDCADVYLYDR